AGRGRAQTALAQTALAHHPLEHLTEAAGHEVVEDAVDGEAEVEEDAGDDVDVLEDVQLVAGPVVDETPHKAIGVEWSPADPKHHHQDNCKHHHQDNCKHQHQDNCKHHHQDNCKHHQQDNTF